MLLLRTIDGPGYAREARGSVGCLSPELEMLLIQYAILKRGLGDL
jgi:hypothetical protein